MEKLFSLPKRYKYLIEVRTELGFPDVYYAYFDKRFGDCHGGCTHSESIPDLKKLILSWVDRWKQFDSIVNRMPDPITQHNLHFESDQEEISKSLVFGEDTLARWF